MNFKSASLKLTFFYLLIVMLISLLFSVLLYRLSSWEIGRGLSRQGRALEQIPNERIPQPLQNLEELRQEQLLESNRHLRQNLIYFNLIILVLSGVLSYYFARRTLKPIEKMVDLQNRFTADASHELRTPLTAMKTEIEVAQRDKNLKPTEIKALLKSNLEEIEKLEMISNGLLKLARFEGDRQKIFEEILLDKIIQKAYQQIRPLARRRQIEFKFNLAKTIIQGEAASLLELFKILFDNAIKYSPQKSRVWVNLKKHGHQAEIQVKDEGIGIKASDLPYVFDRFYRADQSRSKEKASGYGLGLAIAKQIVTHHQGTIEVSSKACQGSTFIVRLPLEKS